jgi:hypothetical protein
MKNQIRIDGVYDRRTFVALKKLGINNFLFDFSPKSFNFIQLHVFADQIVTLLDKSDTVYMHFTSSSDTMIQKIIHDFPFLKEQIIFECDEWVEGHLLNQTYKMINFRQKEDFKSHQLSDIKGVVLEHDFLDELFLKSKLNQFFNDLFLTNGNFFDNDRKIILKANTSFDLKQTLLDLIDYDLISLPINQHVEVCYRNIDVEKLNYEIKNIISFHGINRR